MEDIIPLIIDQVADQSTIRGLTLVNKEFYGPANDRLYNTVYLDSWKGISLFLSPPRYRSKSPIKHLELKITNELPPPSYLTQDVHAVSAPSRQLPFLDTLDLNFDIKEGSFRDHNEESAHLTSILKYLFDRLLIIGPKHFRVRYRLSGINQPCPLNVHRSILEIISKWKYIKSIDLSTIDITRRFGPTSTYNSEFFTIGIKTSKSCKIITIPSSIWEYVDNSELIKTWLSGISGCRTATTDEDPNTTSTKTVKVETDQPASEIGQKNLEQVFKNNHIDHTFELVYIGRDRYSQDTQTWRNRVTKTS